jgi:hypothetical protein
MVDAVGYIANLFFNWLGLFAAPFQDFNMLWIIIPIWISWFFAEFFQEKRGTSFGNAISNGIVPLWVGIDWGKTTVALISSGKIALDAVAFAKFGIVAFMISYGLLIVVEGVRTLKIIHYLGRIRNVTYFAVVLTPIFYGAVPLSLDYILSIFVFFPIFYFIIEIIDRVTPTPKAFGEEEGPIAGAEIPETEMPSFGETPPAETQQPQQPQQQPQQYQQQYPPQYPGGGY